MSKEGKKGRIARFFSDFKSFISKGNIIDMAVGVIIGGAFGKIVTSLVNDIIMPLISLATGGKSVEDWKFVIKEATEETAESALRYGMFIQSIIDFLIIAFCIFLVLRIVMNIRKGIEREMDGEFRLKKHEHKKLMKEYRAKGHTKSEALDLIEKREQELAEIVAAEKKAAQEREAAQKAAIETPEQLLKDIRDILKQNQA